MEEKSICIVPHGNRWKVQCSHCHDQVMDTEQEAIDFAKEHIKGLPPGEVLQILRQRANGRWLTEWRFEPF